MNVLILLNYNDFPEVDKFLTNIKDYKIIDKIVIVDNNSTNDSFEQAKALSEFDSKIEVIKTEKNGGYGYGNNYGIKYALERYKDVNLIISNPDVIVGDGVIEELITELNKNDIALIAPTVLEGNEIVPGRKILTPIKELLLKIPYVYRCKKKSKKENFAFYGTEHYKNKLSYVDVILGCFFIIKGSVMKDIGYYDENMFLYYEEDVIATKLKEKGYKTAILNTVTVNHNHSITINKIYKEYEKEKFKYNSGKYFYKNYYNKSHNFILKLVCFLSCLKIFFKQKVVCPLKKLSNILKIFKMLWVKYHFLVSPKNLYKDIRKAVTNKKQFATEYKYSEWIKINEKNHKYREFNYNPLISVVVYNYNTKAEYLIECLESLINQSYQNFEICIVDNCSSKYENREILKKYEEKNKKVKVKYLDNKQNISEATNFAISIATGEYIAFVNSNDVVNKDALYWNIVELNKNKNLDLIYSDEDKLDYKGKRVKPSFKPDWNPDYLLSTNYISHLILVKSKLVDELEGYSAKYNVMPEYDFVLRVSENAFNICHIPRILYHLRMIPGSCGASIYVENLFAEQKKRIIEEALKRRRLNAKLIPVEENTVAAFDILFENKNEKVSIIIPTNDSIELLKPCIDSIYEKTTYDNFEVILIDHNSKNKESLEYFDDCKNKYDNFKLIRREGEFNYSYLNNEAVKEADGEYIVFLNNDTEIITQNWIEYMLGYARQERIGCVGVKLLYPDNTIQHAGVILCSENVATHICEKTLEKGIVEEERYDVASNYSAVTLACAMVKKEKFEKCKGLNEELPIDYNDVDFCLELLELGYKNIYVPAVKLYHCESKSRGLVNYSFKNYHRWKEAIEYMENKWSNVLEECATSHIEYQNTNEFGEYNIKQDKKTHVFILGCRGYHYKYGGWETFVDNFVDNYDEPNTVFHISELAYEDLGQADPKENVFVDYIKVKNRGSATMLLHTIKAFKYYLKYIEENKIENAYIYILGLKLGPYLIWKKKKIKELKAKIVLNPDGLEWKRAKWGYFTKKFFVLSERLMLNNCDLIICDSKGIIEYIEKTYPNNKIPKKYIAYGAADSAEISIDREKEILEEYNLEPNKYFVVICRFVPENNFELVIREFMKTNIDKELVIITNIDNEKFYSHLLKTTKFDKDKRIRILGAIYDLNVLTAIRKNAFAYIHGHSAGGTNPALLEAMNIVDLNIVYDTHFNTLVGLDSCIYFNSTEGNLSEILCDINGLENQKRICGIKAKEIVRNHFTWKIVVDKYKEIFK